MAQRYEMNRTVRTVTYKDGDLYVTQALEVDIAAQGSTATEAFERFGIALRAEAREAEAAGRDLFDIGPAPNVFHALFQGDVVAREQMVA
jgi:hypothetical protein